jgi:Co/Zn/Cd efflux system component
MTGVASVGALAYGLYRAEALKTLINGALLCLSCIGIG